MSINPFPEFLDDKKKNVHARKDIEIEPSSQTEDVIEENNFQSKKYVPYFYLIAGLVFVALFLRLFYLQVIEGKESKRRAEENRLRIRVEEAPRGIIYDRNNTPLVKNIPAFSVLIYPTDLPKEKDEREKLYQALSGLLKISVSDIKKVEQKRASIDPVIIKENISQEEAIILETKIESFPAVAINKTAKRNYQKTEFALSHILGYTGKMTGEEIAEHPDYVRTGSTGKNGLEYYYDSYLRGSDTKQTIEVNSSGKIVRILASSEGVIGDGLFTSIDAGLQEKMASSLSSAIEKSKGKGGVAIAADPNTGAILGMVSIPFYDNNLFSNNIDQSQYEKLVNDSQKPMFNRAIKGLYPPGSTIKPVIASAALSEKIISTKTTINDPGEIIIINKYNPSISYRFPDWKPGGHGSVNIYQALEWSCDIFFYALGGGWQNIKGLGINKMSAWLSKFGIDKKTDIDLPNEETGFIPSSSWKQEVKKESWYQGDDYHLVIGQGDLLATPIGLLNYTNFFANSGTFYKPKIVWEIKNIKNETVKKFEAEATTKDIVSKDIIDTTREGMRRVCATGTARSLSNLPFTCGGKTGTAQNPHGEPHAFFISFAPYENPKIAVVVLIENGGEGSSVAVPVARDILNYWIVERGN